MTTIGSNPNPNRCAGYTADSYPKPGCSAPEESPEKGGAGARRRDDSLASHPLSPKNGDWEARARGTQAPDPLKDHFSVNSAHSGDDRKRYQSLVNNLIMQVNPGGLLHELDLALNDLLVERGKEGNLWLDRHRTEGESWALVRERLRVVHWGLDTARPSASPDSADGRAWRAERPTHWSTIGNASKLVEVRARRGDLPGIPDDLQLKAEDKAELPPGPNEIVGRYEALEFVRRMANKIALLDGTPSDPAPAGYRRRDAVTGELDLPGWTARLLDGMANIKPFGGMDPEDPRIEPKLNENQFRLKLALEDVYELKDWKRKTDGRPEFKLYTIDHEIQRALMYAVSVTRDMQTQKPGDRVHDNLPTRFLELNKTFGTDVGDSNALIDLARLQPVMDKTNRLLVGYQGEFKKMVQRVNALPFTCYAFGEKGSLAYSEALSEHNKIGRYVNDVRKQQARLNDSEPKLRVGALRDMAKEIQELQKILDAPELRKMDATINLSPRVVEKQPDQDEDFCNSSPPIHPLPLIPPLLDGADDPQLRTLNESINAELRQLTKN